MKIKLASFLYDQSFTGIVGPSLIASIEVDGAALAGGSPGVPSVEITPIATPPTAAAPKERVFTQAEMDRVVTERLARDRQSRGAPAPARTDQVTTDPPRSAVEDLTMLLARQRSFDRVVAKFDLSESALSILESDFASAKPDDVGGWVATRAAAFGWRPVGTTPPSTQSGAAPAPHSATATGHPVTSGGVPPAAQPVRTDKKLHELSPADQRAYAAEVGPIEFKNRLWKEMALVKVPVGRR